MSTTTAHSPHRRRPRRLETIVLVVIGLLVLPLVIVVLGSFIPSIPYLGLGDLASGYAGWFTLALLVLAAGAVWLVTRRRNAARVVVAAVTVLTLVGGAAVTARLLSTGAENGVTINPLAGPPSTTPPDETVQYSTHDGSPLTASLWRPAAGSGDAPVAFFVHGGGWVSGTSTDDNGGLRKRMAAEGWLVVSIEYTLADKTHPTWDVATGQVACALAWTAQNAAAYGGDPSRLAVLGDSAGGNLAVTTSYRAAAGALTSSCGELPVVSAVAVVYPAVAPAAVFANTTPVTGTLGRSFASDFTGGSPEQHPERYEAVTSGTWISPAAPPTFIVQGENDHLVTAPPVEDFFEQADAAGVDVSLVLVPYADHVFDASPIGGQIYVETTLRWLAARDLTGRA